MIKDKKLVFILILQIGFSIFTLASAIATFFDDTFILITQILFIISLLLSAISNVLVKRNMIYSIIYVLIAAFILGNILL